MRCNRIKMEIGMNTAPCNLVLVDPSEYICAEHPAEEYTSCIEGAGCSRRSLDKQLSATVKAKGKSSYFFLKL